MTNTLNVGAKQLAYLFRITEKRVQQLAKQRVIKKEARGRYNLAESVQSYIRFLQDIASEVPGENKTDSGLEPVNRLTKDLRKAAMSLGKHEVRFLVDEYYAMQDQRIRETNQCRALLEDGEPHDLIHWLNDQHSTLEQQIKSALHIYAKHNVIGQWLLSVRGIGPVISAGLLAHIDINQCETVGHIWSYAGLDPTKKWNRGEKRPWNAELKTLCWKIGESFVRSKGHEEAVYGALYDQRKIYEIEKNESGQYAEQAKLVLEKTPKHKQAAIYKAGKLPDGHIHMRAKRYAVKQFLSDLHAYWYRIEFGKEPPLPYPIAILGHAHKR